MNDPEFHAPVQKSSYEPTDPSAAPPNSALAVVSLVFGIVGWVVLPLIGPLIALITGHLALGEIRDSDGRVGGRPLARAGLMLSYSWFGVGIVAAVLLFLFFFRSAGEYQVATPVAPAPVSTGVKMANELTEADLASIRMFHLPDAPRDDEIICYYREADTSTGERGLALLTTKQVSYLKGNRVTTFPLKDVESVMDDDAYRLKYHPTLNDNSVYSIEVKSRTGPVMRIMIRPTADGPNFFHALQDAWKAAAGDGARANVKP